MPIYIFFLYELLPTTYGPQKFSKIRLLKVNYFHLSIHLANDIQNFGSISMRKLILILSIQNNNNSIKIQP